MITALCGTPGTGKTTTARILEENGLKVASVSQIIRDLGAEEGVDPGSGELIVDIERLSLAFRDWANGVSGDLVVEGHLSYLVPSSLILLFRTDPNVLRERLLSRGYTDRKAWENAEAEAVSYLLFECMEREKEALSGRGWSTLPDGTPIVLETDTTKMTPMEQADWVRRMISARKEKDITDMLHFRPPNVDWMEVVAGWY